MFLARSLHRASAPRPQGLNAMNSRRDFGNLLGAMQMEDVRRSSAQCIAAASMAVSPRAEGRARGLCLLRIIAAPFDRGQKRLKDHY